MSTTTATFGHHSTATSERAASAAPKRKGFYQRFIDARLRQGKAYANSVLTRMPDAQLSELGFSDEQIREVRASGAVPTSFWR